MPETRDCQGRREVCTGFRANRNRPGDCSSRQRAAVCDEPLPAFRVFSLSRAKESTMLRDRVIATRVSAEELRLVRDLADSRGLSLSEQVREAMLIHVMRVGKSIVPRRKAKGAAA
jgi:hypothetical protein